MTWFLVYQSVHTTQRAANRLSLLRNEKSSTTTRLRLLAFL